MNIRNVVTRLPELRFEEPLNWIIEEGQQWGVIGPNGAGKTTTMKIMAGLLSPDFGNITFDDYSLWKQSSKIKRFIGYLPEQV